MLSFDIQDLRANTPLKEVLNSVDKIEVHPVNDPSDIFSTSHVMAKFKIAFFRASSLNYHTLDFVSCLLNTRNSVLY